jgi:DedD protein
MAADGLKQRLVGGAALFVIGVIAWFWLLSADSPVDPVARESQIPAAPDIKPFVVPEPVAPADIPPIESVVAPVAQRSNAVPPSPSPRAAGPKESPRPDTTAVAKAEPKPAATRTAPETFELDQQGLPVAWVVQVGLFSTQTNADKIKAALQDKGFKAYTQVVTAPKPGVKVLVGPKLSRERADAQKKAIDQALKMNTMVVRFSTN